MEKKKMLSPQNAKGWEGLWRLRRDNKSVPGGFILVGNGTVTLQQQRAGKPPAGRITLTKSDFNKLIAWYQKEQSCE